MHNKVDLSGAPARAECATDETRLWLSARTGEGLQLLRAELARHAGRDEAGNGAFSARARHVQALQQVAEHLQSAHAQLLGGAGELAAEELRRAQQQLGAITGEFSSDDLLDAIFSSFCIGK